MNVIVTGSTGFAGRELVAELLRQKDHVTVLVRNRRHIPEEWTGTVRVVEASMEQYADLDRDYTSDSVVGKSGIEQFMESEL